MQDIKNIEELAAQPRRAGPAGQQPGALHLRPQHHQEGPPPAAARRAGAEPSQWHPSQVATHLYEVQQNLASPNYVGTKN